MHTAGSLSACKLVVTNGRGVLLTLAFVQHNTRETIKVVGTFFCWSKWEKKDNGTGLAAGPVTCTCGRPIGIHSGGLMAARTHLGHVTRVAANDQPLTAGYEGGKRNSLERLTREI